MKHIFTACYVTIRDYCYLLGCNEFLIKSEKIAFYRISEIFHYIQLKNRGKKSLEAVLYSCMYSIAPMVIIVWRLKRSPGQALESLN